MKDFGIYRTTEDEATEGVTSVLANDADEALTVFKAENPKAQIDGTEGYWAEELDA